MRFVAIILFMIFFIALLATIVVLIQKIVESYKKLEHEKGRVLGFIGMLLTVLYAVYIFIYFSDSFSDNALSSFIASSLIMRTVGPHMLCALGGAALSVYGLLTRTKNAILLASIAMFAAGIVFPMYFRFVVVQAITLFIAYIRMMQNENSVDSDTQTDDENDLEESQ